MWSIHRTAHSRGNGQCTQPAVLTPAQPVSTETWRTPNEGLAGIIIDAIRAAKIAKDRGVGGALLSASSYLMKSPPEQRPDDLGRETLEAFIRGDAER